MSRSSKAPRWHRPGRRADQLQTAFDGRPASRGRGPCSENRHCRRSRVQRYSFRRAPSPASVASWTALCCFRWRAPRGRGSPGAPRLVPWRSPLRRLRIRRRSPGLRPQRSSLSGAGVSHDPRLLGPGRSTSKPGPGSAGTVSDLECGVGSGAQNSQCVVAGIAARWPRRRRGVGRWPAPSLAGARSAACS